MLKMKFVASMLALSLMSTGAWAAVNAPDDRLALAAQRGDRRAVEALLRSHVAVDGAEGDGTTALHWAVYENDLALAQLLLNAHAKVNVKTRIKAETPLFLACQNGSAEMIELLLKNGAEVNGTNVLGTTPLMIAAASGNGDAVTVLLNHGAEANARESSHEQTALMFAANLDRGDAIRALVEHGADPNLQSKVTPIEKPQRGYANPNVDPNNPADGAPDAPPQRKARSKDTGLNDGSASSDDTANATMPGPNAKKGAGGDSKAAAAAAPMGRDRGPTMMGGFAPLHYAARQGSIAATIALLDKGANIDEVTLSEQSTPLVLAIANGHLDLAKALVERGADVNKANVMGVTPLYATIDVAWVPHEWSPEPVTAQEKTSHVELMKLILAHGADPNARLGRAIWSRVLAENRVWIDVSGSTAFFRAAMADDVPSMQLLKEAGADPNLTNKTGTTPLMAAAGLGWGAAYSATAPDRMAAVRYCISLGGKITAQDDLGFTPLHGAAFVGDLPLIQYLVDNGARLDVKTRAGDTVADSANGPFEKSLPQPAAVALLVKLGAPAPTNCRSSDCIVATKEDKPGGAGGGRRRQAPAVDAKPADANPVNAAKPADAPRPVVNVNATPHE